MQTLTVSFTELFYSFGLIISNFILPLIIHDSQVALHSKTICLYSPDIGLQSR
jgi:hypothetical protein